MPEHDADDIISVGHVCNTKNPSIDLRRSRDLSLLAKCNSCERRSNIIYHACLHFDETKRFAIECDQVDLASYFSSVRVTANRRFKVAHYEPIAVPGEELCGELFAFCTDRPCIRRAVTLIL